MWSRSGFFSECCNAPSISLRVKADGLQEPMGPFTLFLPLPAAFPVTRPAHLPGATWGLCAPDYTRRVSLPLQTFAQIFSVKPSLTNFHNITTLPHSTLNYLYFTYLLPLLNYLSPHQNISSTNAEIFVSSVH